VDLTIERRDSSEATCPLCREQVGADHRLSCACGVEYHPECRAELAGCVTLGCEAAPTVVPPSPGRRGRRRCCRCNDQITNRPVNCATCGERHHRWCRGRECRTRAAERAARRAAAPAEPPPAAEPLLEDRRPPTQPAQERSTVEVTPPAERLEKQAEPVEVSRPFEVDLPARGAAILFGFLAAGSIAGACFSPPALDVGAGVGLALGLVVALIDGLLKPPRRRRRERAADAEATPDAWS
jgi:hypothetical protein